ncbi:MAG TPA: amino acid adenylation domain-containing protein, partial [Pseudonocardiaceae bacterium]|nr:amino acid adenylation domain-containing protein [Pseudonocardiaceae bacterium]
TAGALAELPYWSGQPVADPLPRDGDGPNRAADAREIYFTLDEQTTDALLKDVPRVFGTRINSVLITALALALRTWTGSGNTRIDLEGHGREDLFGDVDLSRTVGWFTSIFPVSLALDPAWGPIDALTHVHHTLDAIPDNGVGYGILRHLADPGTRRALTDQPVPDICFNYLGQFDGELAGLGRLAPDTEPAGRESDPLATRAHVLDVHGVVTGGSLTMSVTYSPFVHSEQTIRALAEGIESALVESVRAAQDRSGPDDHVERYPLSPLQAGMLFHSLSGSVDVRPYVVQLVDEFVGDFDDRAFANAWQRLVRRHGILRTSFVWDGVDEPLQIVRRHGEIPIAHLDWREHPAAEHDHRLAALLADDRHAGFDLGTAPLMRFTLVRTADDRRIVLWTFHHLLLDGWSTQLVQHEFRTLYEAEHQRTAASLPEPGQYAPYIDWLRAQPRDQAEAFWRAEFDGVDAATDLVGAANAAGGPGGADDVEITWEHDRSRRLNDFARTHQITVNTLVQAAWALLQSRYTGSTDVLHGTTVAGRPADLPLAESTVGLFINTLPVRTTITPAQTVADWLTGLQEHHSELRDHGHSGLTEIHGWSGLPRTTALFQSIVIFENYPKMIDDGDELPGLAWHRLTGVEHTDYPLTVLAQGGDTFGVRLVYRTDQFDRAAIERMAGHLSTLLDAITTNPDAPVGRLPMLTEDETRQLLVDWNDTAVRWPSQLCAHELITRQAERSPDATAVTFGDQGVSYRELEERSNQIAHWLIDAGAGPETLAGICVERGIDMIAAVLGVLKAGGAYVPLATDHPRDRLEFILADTAAPVILTQRALAAKFTGDRRVCCLDGDDVTAYPTTNPGPRATPDDLAYILYTSGSTGRPKGVRIQHEALTNLLHAMQDVLCMTPEDHLLAVTTTIFDISNLEMLQPLVNGAHIHIAGRDEVHSPELLATILADHGITLIQSTPSLWKTVLDEITHLDSPLRILLGGEALDPDLVARTQERLPRSVTINGYGPTEAAIYTTTMSLTDRQSAVVPIGRPVANVEVFVLDPAGRVVPVGVVGELYIGGAGLARGYHNRPDLTAERFVHKHIGGRNRLVYRTGDLVRWLPDSTIEYLGRTDDQVKIRGFRIELGEIETALRAHPQVAEAVVMARADNPGDRRLVAYLVPADPAEGVDIPAVRARLRDRLPDYMIPSAFLTLGTIPLGPSGKIDKRALPAPDGSRPDLADAYVAPSGPVEHAIAEVWSQVLGVERVGAHDNFFELGGDSILGIQVTSRVRRLGFALTPRMMFQHETVARIAANIDTTGLPRASQAKVTGSSPLTPVQHWLFDRELAHPHHFNQSVLLHVDDLDPDLLEKALTALAEQHDALRSRFAPGVGGTLVQHYADTLGGPVVRHVDL